MTNNRIMKIIGNTVGLAAVAALGITVYQLGTAPVKEETREERTEQEEKEKNFTVDVGTQKVEADMEGKENSPEEDNIEGEEGENREDTEEMEV